MDYTGIQKRRKDFALKVHVTAVVISCADTPTTSYARMMKSCDVVDFTLDALTNDTPRTKAFLMTMHNMATDILKHVDPLKQILETGIRNYKIRSIPRYLDRNMQWKPLLSTDIFEPATQYDQAMKPYIKVHLSYKIDSIIPPKDEQTAKAPAALEVQEYEKKTLDALLKLIQTKHKMPLDQSLGRLCQIFQDMEDEKKVHDADLLTPPPTPKAMVLDPRTSTSSTKRPPSSTRGRSPQPRRRPEGHSRHESVDRQKPRRSPSRELPSKNKKKKRINN